jgi:RNA polymerase sigma-70 factor (ECF subfamily)
LVAHNPNDDARTDLQLIDAVNAGDSLAFEVLYRRYRDWVVNLAMRFCNDPDIALDVLQETFIYFLKKFPGFVLTAQLKTFLYPTVKHLAIGAKKKQRRQVQESVDQPFDAFVSAPDVHEPVDQTRADLASVLADLPAHQREVLLLRFVDGLNINEIAQTLEIPPGTVKSRVHLALKTLRGDPKIKKYFDPQSQ